MIIEQGTVAAIEPNCLWVATVRRATCSGCKAEAGCGQSILAKVSGHNPLLRVLLNGEAAEQFKVGDAVAVGVPESLVATGSLISYLLPLLGLLVTAGIAHHLLASDGITALAALLGLVVSGALLRRLAWLLRDNPRMQPVLISPHTTLPLRSPLC